ncbi:unnamed protein product [Symbiodinium sp. KB8]|nr:unnamed protein product [Symbiodinium sp. KB8]
MWGTSGKWILCALWVLAVRGLSWLEILDSQQWAEAYSEGWLAWLFLQGAQLQKPWNLSPATAITSSPDMQQECLFLTTLTSQQKRMWWEALQSSGASSKMMSDVHDKAGCADTGSKKGLGPLGSGFWAGAFWIPLAGYVCSAALWNPATNLVNPCSRMPAGNIIRNLKNWIRRPGRGLCWLSREVSRAARGAWKHVRQHATHRAIAEWNAMLMLLLPLALSLASFGLCYIVFEELAQHQGEMIRCPTHVLARMHVCWQFHAESSVSNRQIGMQLYHCSCEGSRAQECQGTLKTGQECCMVERLADSSSGEYVDMLNEEEEPLDTLTTGDMTATGTASTARTDAAPAASEDDGRTPWQPRVIRDRLGQLVREPTGPPPIVLEAEDYEDSDEWAAEPEESSQNLEEDEMIEPARTDASLAEMDPNYRHISLAMSTAISEVLRRHGNTQETFHVLSVPPIDWLHTKGFKMVTVPLTKEMRRHPNLLKCSDGPRFAPPQADRSEMTDAEEAEEDALLYGPDIFHGVRDSHIQHLGAPEEATTTMAIDLSATGAVTRTDQLRASVPVLKGAISSVKWAEKVPPDDLHEQMAGVLTKSNAVMDPEIHVNLIHGSWLLMLTVLSVLPHTIKVKFERELYDEPSNEHTTAQMATRGTEEQPTIQTQQTLRNQREARTLRMISWNTGGLHSARYNEVLVWLDDQASAGRPVDLLFLQETHWKQDYEYVATPVEGKALQYRVIHSAGDDKAGLMCMIRTGIVPDSHIRHHALLPGRLLHIRLMFPTPVDIMNTYQFAWNPNKAVGTVDNQRTQQQDQETFQEILRGVMDTAMSRQATPFDAPFVRAHLRHPQQAIDMQGQIAADLDQAHEMDDLDQILLRGCEPIYANLGMTTARMRQDCRQRKTLKIIDAVNSDNVFVAAKRFAPKQPRRRLQLRSKEGHLQSHEAEFEQICSYFRDLFKGPVPKQCPLPEQVTFTEEEVSQALGKLAAGKAKPSTSAPAAIWKLASAQVTPHLCKQFSAVLVAGATELPAEWSQSELVLLPKPGKSLTSPSQLRPINLLPLQAKVLGAVLAMRLQEYAQWFLWEVPQYAYLQGRSLGQALERVAGQCAAIRSKLQAQTCNPHAKKEGHRLTQVGGGCFLSLDISKAYDHVDWRDLTQALAAAKVPESLISLIMMIHREARIRIQHCGHECTIAMGRGLRQGCSLAPILWSIYSGWVLTKLHRPGLVDIPKCNTSYADDLFFGWTVSSGQEMATVYRAIRHILEGLGKQGLQLSLDKTVIVLGLKGTGAATCLKRYVVERAGMQGQFMKFQIGGEAAYVKIVKQHLYLGAQISFQKYEQATAKHRAPNMANGVPMETDQQQLEDHSQADQTNGEHRQKYHKGGPKGVQGKGRGQRGQPKVPFGNSWRSPARAQGAHPQTPWKVTENYPWREGELMDMDPAHIKAAIQMLTTVVIRHESQHAIARQDTSYVLFVRTDVPDSLAKSTFAVAQQWQEIKAKTPEKLRHPMRAILFQHVIKVTMEKFEMMVASPSSRSTAVSLDWMSTDEQKVNGLKWDPEARKHVKDDQIQPLGIQEIREALQEILAACIEPLVIARFHATRKLAQEYTSQNLTMMLEIGLRTEQANLVWRRLNQLEKSGVWVAAGVYLRREGMQRSALVQRLAAITGS